MLELTQPPNDPFGHPIGYCAPPFTVSISSRSNSLISSVIDLPLWSTGKTKLSTRLQRRCCKSLNPEPPEFTEKDQAKLGALQWGDGVISRIQSPAAAANARGIYL